MKRAALTSTILGGVLFAMLNAAPAVAQATRTWVSGVGDDANPCSRTAPCKTFPGAYSKTAVGGEINCLDPGGFGTITISKSLTINCEGTFGSILASSTNGVVINGGPNDVITLKGFEIEGVRFSSFPGLSGVIFNSGAELHMHKFQIRNFNNNGIQIATSTNAKIFLADGYISDAGTAVGNAGILIRPVQGANVSVSVNRVQMEGNSNGIFMDGSGGGGIAHANVNDSILSGSSNSGIAIAGAGPAFTAVVANSTMSSNINTGAAAFGAGASLKLGGNTISNNVTGVAGTVQSFKNNQISDNSTDGTPLTAVSSGGLILN